MALATADDIITAIKAHYKGIDTTSATDALATTINELCRDTDIVHGTASLATTAEVGEYTFASGSPWYTLATTTTATTLPVVKIDSVHYLSSATSYTRLEETSVQELNARFPEWQYASSGTPQYVYAYTTSAGQTMVGFYPIPDTTTTPTMLAATANNVSFPRIDFRYRAKYGSTFTGTVTVPSSITDPDVLIEGALWRLHKRENTGNAGPHFQLYMKAKSNLVRELQTRLRENKPEFTPMLRAPRVR